MGGGGTLIKEQKNKRYKISEAPEKQTNEIADVGLSDLPFTKTERAAEFY